MAPRVPKTEITGFSGFMIKRFSRKMFGGVPEPLEVCCISGDRGLIWV